MLNNQGLNVIKYFRIFFPWANSGLTEYHKYWCRLTTQLEYRSSLATSISYIHISNDGRPLSPHSTTCDIVVGSGTGDLGSCNLVGVDAFLVVGHCTAAANLLLYDRGLSRFFARAILIDSRLIAK